MALDGGVPDLVLSLLWWRRPWRVGGMVEREEGGQPRSGMVEMLAVRPPAAVENSEAERRSAVAAKRVRSSCGDFL